MTEREQMLDVVRIYDFARHDTTLFLDAHPTNTAALQYYKTACENYKKAVADYEASYGPLTPSSANADETQWRWIDNPWPWEGADE